MRRIGTRLLGLALCVGLAWPATAATSPPTWTGSWATALVPTDAANLPAPQGEVTIRQVVRLGAGGPRLRLRLANTFGTAPLRIDGARVALAAAPGGSGIVAETDRAVTFDGQAGVTIPPGATWLSDPVDLPVEGLARLAVSLRLPEVPRQASVHRSARTTAFVVAGDQSAAPELAGATTFTQWAQLAGVDVERPSGNGIAVVTLGDSITDGSGAGVDVYERWPDVLAARLQADPRTKRVSVLNVGIGGNKLLKDGSGQAALARLDRDVLTQPGVKALIVLIGINDIGGLSREGEVTPEKRTQVVTGLIAAYRQIVTRAHERGIRVIGATILPCGGTKVYRSDADADADRQAVNAWIRGSGVFDAVVDFDRVTRDPAHPERLLPAYDSGDQLHPSPAGYKAMGEAVAIGALVKR
ncbi:lysophospholipase L1-like esterase [Caulobacter rhizosphaerae]|uniref:Lysophospholipase L1-like esterase n=1 Tax=Caulobacter rhizosphaerae TaxID=2010972 RepID=A0ABU1N134_9CAUL|nr:SGNH/GDSL hydrolase family protein [Caulobacter rhizosphaerae]MDR6532012.1 lysophospholipase L1-like esterase [Caulobacter rhizosphaerae]